MDANVGPKKKFSSGNVVGYVLIALFFGGVIFAIYDSSGPLMAVGAMVVIPLVVLPLSAPKVQKIILVSLVVCIGLVAIGVLAYHAKSIQRQFQALQALVPTMAPTLTPTPINCNTEKQVTKVAVGQSFTAPLGMISFAVSLPAATNSQELVPGQVYWPTYAFAAYVYPPLCREYVDKVIIPQLVSKGNFLSLTPLFSLTVTPTSEPTFTPDE